MLCHNCKTEIKIKARVLRSDECPQCSSDLHCCLNCMNYDPSAHNRCREPQAEWVSDREKANFCDFFEPNKVPASHQRSITDAKKSFDDLFKH